LCLRINGGEDAAGPADEDVGAPQERPRNAEELRGTPRNAGEPEEPASIAAKFPHI
jgi:hypothetical protein